MMLQVKPISSMMWIIIEMELQTRSYFYWMILSNIFFGSAIYMPYERTLCYKISDLWSWCSNVNLVPIRWTFGLSTIFVANDRFPARNYLRTYYTCFYVADSWAFTFEAHYVYPVFYCTTTIVFVACFPILSQ